MAKGAASRLAAIAASAASSSHGAAVRGRSSLPRCPRQPPRGDRLRPGKRATERTEREEPAGAEQRTRHAPRMPGSHAASAAESIHPVMAMIAMMPELSERLLRGLPPKLRRERLVGPLPFGFELRALEIHPGAVAVERLLERGNDDASEAGFETASRLAGRGQPGLRVGPGAQLARHLGEPADRVDHAHPLRDPHPFSLWSRRR